MVETLFKLGCLMFACFTAFAYLLVSFEEQTIVTRQPQLVYTTPAVLAQKKGCECCTERRARMEQMIQQARARKQAEANRP